MHKKADPRRLRASLTYTVIDLATILGVSPGTVRSWIRQGLRTLNSSRPMLILGSDAKEFLRQSKTASKQPLKPDEVFCLTCKAPKKVFGGMVVLNRSPGRPLRITGFCADCEGICSRVVGAKQIARLQEIFDVSFTNDRAP